MLDYCIVSKNDTVIRYDLVQEDVGILPTHQRHDIEPNETYVNWSQEHILHFIDAYKQKDILWNPKNRFYYNKIKKTAAWAELAAEIGHPVEECKKKMEYLLANLRREKMKAKKCRDEVYRSSWFAYKSMAFILDKNTLCETVSILQKGKEESETGEDSLSEILQNQIQQPPSEFTNPSISKKKKLSIDQRLEAAFKLSNTRVKHNATDECYHFGIMIAAKLRKYGETVRCDIQNDILALFSKANKGFYN
ncbi:hypothetical protein PGB90_005005 [Kerria lacca]